MIVKFALNHPQAQVPKYMTAGAGCFDLHAVIDDPQGITIAPGEAKPIRTGLIAEIEPGWRLDLVGRSGHWFKNRVRLGNCVGKIDSDYRGEIMVSLENAGTEPYTVKPGERIAQGEFNPVHQATIVVVSVDEIGNTERGTGGFGSTQK